MRSRSGIRRAGAVARRGALLLALLAPATAHARTVVVPAVWHAAATAIADAAAGDTVLLARGVHEGPLIVNRAITLRGEPGAIVDGGGEGAVISVSASGSTVEDLAVRASGSRVITIDAGLRVIQAGGVHLRRLRLADVLYGVYAERATGLEVSDCTLVGRVPAGKEDGEGNGIHLWYTSGARLAHDDVAHFQDAIYLSFADDTRALDNRLHDNGRYGFHTMYCQDGELLANTFAHNVAGCAIMFSNHLRVIGNAFIHNRGSRTYGLLLRDCSDGLFEDNRMADDTIGMFLDDSNRNIVRGNLIQDDGWGVLLFSSCAGNTYTRNSFVNDDYPVALDMKYTDNRFDDGRVGNYWSANTPYDLNGDGVSDTPYSPVGTFAFLSKQYPDLAILAKSPAVAALSVAEQVLPALRPSEAVDRFPLVTPPAAVAGAAHVAGGRALAPGTGIGEPPTGARARMHSRWGSVACGTLALTSLAGLVLGRRAS